MHLSIRKGLPQRNLGMVLGACLFVLAIGSLATSLGLGCLGAGIAQVWCAIGIFADLHDVPQWTSPKVYARLAVLYLLQGVVFGLSGSLFLTGVMPVDWNRPTVPMTWRLIAQVPAAPTNWIEKEKPRSAEIKNVGIHAWASYRPENSQDALGIARVEVTISIRQAEASKEDIAKLRRLDTFEGQLMTPNKVNGLSALQSADFPSEKRRVFVLSVFVSSEVTVDILLIPSADEATPAIGIRPKIAMSFAEKIDFSKLAKEMKK